jgi:5-methylcytosine-specific restriction endonuclease McrA
VKQSRTGTGKWQRIRKHVLAEALANGQITCPICARAFDWTRANVPRSPEVDHIKPHALGGSDATENLRVICRKCNGRLGGQLGRARRAQRRRNLRSEKLQTTTDW